MTPGLFEKLDTTPPGVGGEIQITDALHALAQSEPVFGLAFEGARLDIGNQLEFIKSNLLMGLEDPRMKEPLWDFIQSLKQLDVKIPGAFTPSTPGMFWIASL